MQTVKVFPCPDVHSQFDWVLRIFTCSQNAPHQGYGFRSQHIVETTVALTT